jgi:hypothetical protein
MTSYFIKIDRFGNKKSPPLKESFSLVLSQTTDNHLIITTQRLIYYLYFLKNT